MAMAVQPPLLNAQAVVPQDLTRDAVLMISNLPVDGSDYFD
jgi:hypothetical protein